MFVWKPWRGQTAKYSFLWMDLLFFLLSPHMILINEITFPIVGGCWKPDFKTRSAKSSTEGNPLYWIALYHNLNCLQHKHSLVCPVDLSFFFGSLYKQLYKRLLEKQVPFRQLFFFLFYCWLIAKIFHTCTHNVPISLSSALDAVFIRCLIFYAQCETRTYFSWGYNMWLNSDLCLSGGLKTVSSCSLQPCGQMMSLVFRRICALFVVAWRQSNRTIANLQIIFAVCCYFGK